MAGFGEPPDKVAPVRRGKPHRLASRVLGGRCLCTDQEHFRLHAHELDVIKTETALTSDMQTLVHGKLSRRKIPGFLCAPGTNQMIQTKMLDGSGVQNPGSGRLDRLSCPGRVAQLTCRVGPEQLAARSVIFPSDRLVDLFGLRGEPGVGIAPRVEKHLHPRDHAAERVRRQSRRSAHEKVSDRVRAGSPSFSTSGKPPLE